MNLAIQDIRLTRSDVSDSQMLFESEFDPKEIKFDFNFDLDFVAVDTVKIFVHVRYSLSKDSNSKTELMHCDSHFIFGISDMIKGFKNEDQQKGILITIFSVAYSTLRGIVYEYTKGYQINKYLLPLITPSQILSGVESDEKMIAKINALINEDGMEKAPT